MVLETIYDNMKDGTYLGKDRSLLRTHQELPIRHQREPSRYFSGCELIEVFVNPRTNIKKYYQ